MQRQKVNSLNPVDAENNPTAVYLDDKLGLRVPRGRNGAIYTQIVDVNGNPISSTNRLPVDAQLTGGDS